MTAPPVDLDDVGIFALVVLATVATAAGLSVSGYPLWLTVPAAVAYAVLGEVAARRLAAMKWGQA